MKRLILLIFALILLGACAGPSPASQTTPKPAPIPTPPTPSTPPEPSPSPQPAEVPHYQITLLSFSGVVGGESTGHTQLFFAGEIRNDSKTDLTAVQVVITAYNSNNEIVAVDKWHTFYSVIRPRKTDKFGIAVTDYATAVRYEVSFEPFEPGIIELSVERGVSTEFWR